MGVAREWCLMNKHEHSHWHVLASSPPASPPALSDGATSWSQGSCRSVKVILFDNSSSTMSCNAPQRYRVQLSCIGLVLIPHWVVYNGHPLECGVIAQQKKVTTEQLISIANEGELLIHWGSQLTLIMWLCYAYSLLNTLATHSALHNLNCPFPRITLTLIYLYPIVYLLGKTWTLLCVYIPPLFQRHFFIWWTMPCIDLCTCVCVFIDYMYMYTYTYVHCMYTYVGKHCCLSHACRNYA